MRILIAPDAFKGSLSATRAAEAMAAGIRDAVPAAEIDMLPLADGGEGTLDVLARYIPHGASPAMRGASLQYVDDDANATALIESARCLGLTLPEMQALDVWQRGSGGLGECILESLDAGIRRFVIGLGGSATNDAGLGMLTALGLRAADAQGRAVSPDLRGLSAVDALDASSMDARLAECEMTILCDVDVPLCGPKGATFTFGQQKGLAADDLGPVDQAMKRFADLAAAAFGRPTDDDVQGDGAAGGLGFALRLLGGRLVSGAEYIIGMSGLDDRLGGADWVVTGEGCSDMQTLAGKLPWVVANMARRHGTRVAILSGMVREEVVAALQETVDLVVATSDYPPESTSEAYRRLTEKARAVGQLFGPGKGDR